MIRVEYVWIDGTSPVKKLRSKVRYVSNKELDLPTWNFDGSSTNQSSGHNSDCLLKPVRIIENPLNEKGIIALCEVYNFDNTPHSSNTRNSLIYSNTVNEDKLPVVAFEQEYVLLDPTNDNLPLGWPRKSKVINNLYSTGSYYWKEERENPSPQGQYYCGVGAANAFGRQIVEEHAKACLDANLLLCGTNAEVLLGQWEFQIGYRGLDEGADPLLVADHLWLARFLLEKIAEKHNVIVSYDCKPVEGDWNGSGCHTNFSTAAMREENGLIHIEAAIEKLKAKHNEHIAVYGHGLEKRLTGKHETCSIKEFRSGVADRGASIRIPRHVFEAKKGYLEDRRPGANCDPYEVSNILLRTVCGE